MTQKANDSNIEIEKFNQLAHSWWDKNGPFKPLHDMNPLRLQWVQSIFFLRDKNILDIGCGGGIFSESAAHLGANVTAIDQADKVLQIAKLHASSQKLNINYQQSNINDWADKHQNTYDIVTAFELLEHVPDPTMVIDACFRLLKPGGYVFFSTINRNLKSYLFAILGAEYVLNLLPKGTHEYQKFICPHELTNWCTERDLNVENITGITYNPFTKVFKLNEKDLDVNYFLCAKK